MTHKLAKKIKRRIIFSIYDDIGNPAYGGGGPRVVYEITKRLSDIYSITVFVGRYQGASSVERDGVFYHYIGTQRFGPRAGQLIYSILLLWYVTRERFDVWIESSTPPFSMSFLAFFTRKPVILLIQMLSAEDMQRKYKLPFYLIERFGLSLYTSFIVVTEYLQHVVTTINHRAAVTIIPCGVTMPKISYSPGKYFLYTGRIEINQKGLDLLLSAYAAFPKRHAVPLMIAGGGNERDMAALKTMIKKHKLGSRVTLFGRYGEGDKQQLFGNALAVIMPSRFETFGTVALEALSYGRPVVYFSLPNLSWIPKNAGVAVKPFLVSELTEALESLAPPRDLSVYFDRNRAFARPYDWDALTRRYRRVIKSCLIT